MGRLGEEGSSQTGAFGVDFGETFWVVDRHVLFFCFFFCNPRKSQPKHCLRPMPRTLAPSLPRLGNLLFFFSEASMRRGTISLFLCFIPDVIYS